MNENDAFTQLAFHFKERRGSDIGEVSQLPNCWEVFPTIQGKLRQVSESESEVAQSCPTLRPCGLQPTRLLCPWDSPGKNTGVGCHFLLQRIFPTQGLNLGLLHCRQMLYPLSHQGRQVKTEKFVPSPVMAQLWRRDQGQVLNSQFLSCNKYLGAATHHSLCVLSLSLFFIYFFSLKQVQFLLE